MVKIAFVHPDLGIGGAERLICDSALALQASGHTVKIFTSHHDPSHCFEETRNGELKVEAVGDWLPRHVMWKLFAFFAYLRMVYVACYLVLFSSFDPDVVICDQVSVCVPVLKCLRKSKIIFYCHFPDMLLTQRKTLLKKLYRAPLDWLEEQTTGLADIVLVNSKFTAQIFEETFKSLSHVKPIVLYPSLNTDGFNKDITNLKNPLENKIPKETKYIFLSINRYERKKNLPLAIKALKELKDLVDEEEFKKVQLVIAGGYDERVDENKEHYLELGRLSVSLNLKDNIVFLCSFTDEQKIFLLQTSTCLLYTPSNEHFGIVPVEGMYMKLPVIACRSGGPLETIKDGVTGYLCEPEPEQFAKAMKEFIDNKNLKLELGLNGHDRVDKYFSFQSFTSNFDNIVVDLCNDSSTSNEKCPMWMVVICVGLLIVICSFLIGKF